MTIPPMLTPPPRLDLPGFTLRVWSAGDAPALRETLAGSDAHLRAFTPWVVDGRVPGVSLADRLTEHAAAFAAGTEWVYGIFSVDGREVLGGCGLYPRVGPGAVELGYWLSVAHTGRGLATRAAATLTTLAFEDSAINAVEIHCDARNAPSARVPQRLGYRCLNASSDMAGVETDELMIWRLNRTEFAASCSPGFIPTSALPSLAT